jgi:repressor LexA
MKLTAAQKRIIEAIKQFIDDHEYPPTVRDIQKIMGLKSPASVHTHLKNLRKMGKINREKGVARSITLNQGTK